MRMVQAIRESLNGSAWIVSFVLQCAFVIIVALGGYTFKTSIDNLQEGIKIKQRRLDNLEERFNARTDRFASIESRQAAGEVRDAGIAEALSSLRVAIDQLRRELQDHRDESLRRR